MTLQFADRVQETFSTTGTSTISLGGSVVGYQAFGSVCNNGDTAYYAATDGTNWEVGLGTYATSGNTLTRTTIIASSNSGAAVNWAAGTKNIWLNAPARIYKAPTITKLTSGSGTYTTPTGATYLKVRMVGAGAGGSGSGSSGAGAGSAGNDSTFGTTLLDAGGGQAPNNGGGQLGGLGGSASLGSGPSGLAIVGGDGACPVYNQAAGGNGGSSAFGGAGYGCGGSTAGAGANAATNSGSGGGGASASASFNGGGGGSGGYVDALITLPLATYAYVVGAGGAGGIAGSSGNAGGNGGSGVILIEEHYGF